MGAGSQFVGQQIEFGEQALADGSRLRGGAVGEGFEVSVAHRVLLGGAAAYFLLAKKAPNPDEEEEVATKSEKAKKGKIIDVVQKGYKLKDKVTRFAKVVVGE